MITQPRVVTGHNDGNHEHIQPVDEVVRVQQPWRSITPGYNLPKINASRPITTFASFQNQPSRTNIPSIPINSKME